MYFDDWQGVVRILIIGPAAYAALVVAVRVSGKRTLAKMNAFDLIVSVALGSTLATVIVTTEVALAEGVLALALLCAAQFVIAWGSTRARVVRRMVKSEPTLLLSHGELREAELARERLTAGEVRQAVRASGRGALEDIAAVVLETDGTISVITEAGAGTGSALTDVSFDDWSRTDGRED